MFHKLISQEINEFFQEDIKQITTTAKKIYSHPIVQNAIAKKLNNDNASWANYKFKNGMYREMYKTFKNASSYTINRIPLDAKISPEEFEKFMENLKSKNPKLYYNLVDNYNRHHKSNPIPLPNGGKGW